MHYMHIHNTICNLQSEVPFLFIPVIVGVLVRTVAVVAVVALLGDAPGHSLLLSAHRRKLPERIK